MQQAPHDCQDMAQLRQQIDALDERIVPLLAERSTYIARAARIKQRADQIVDMDRVEFIVARVKAQAEALAAPPAVIEAAYRALIAASIDYESGEFSRLRQGEMA
ncbi:MAG: chorismate mutase [Curvibacter sp.]|nr:chorismate mutase [Curvibacter sp.]